MNSIPRKPLVFPRSEEAEQGLLGALLVHNGSYEKVCDFLGPEHFYVSVHGRIYAAIADILTQGKTCSPVILKTMFADDGDLEGVGGVGYFADLCANVVTILNVEEYGRAIYDHWQRRQTMEVLDEALAAVADVVPGSSAAKVISELEASLYGIAESGATVRGPREFSLSVAEAITSIIRAHQRDPGAIGLSTGFVDVDKIIGGLRRTDLIILAGRPSMGKTALATGIAWNVAATGHRVAFFSLEMAGEQLAKRIMASDAQVSLTSIIRGETSDRDVDALRTSAHRLSTIAFDIDDRAALTLAQMRNAARRIKRTKGMDLIVVDYLQLISSGQKRAENRVQEVTEITSGLKAMAKEFNVPVIALSQLSRATEKRDERIPQLSDLRDSGSIEQDADIVGFVYREQYYVERDEPTQKKDEMPEMFEARYRAWGQRLAACSNKASLVIAKNRHGAFGTAEMHFDGATTAFSNLAANYSVAGGRR